MALIPKLTLVTASTTYAQIAMQESTGTYNASTNPGGYGTPNVELADSAQYCFAFKKNFSSTDANHTNLLDNTTPEDGDGTKTWTLNISSTGSNTDDGWYKFYLLVAPKYNGATAYTVNQMVSSVNILYKCIQAGTGQTPASSPTYWTAVNMDDTVENLEAILDDESTYSMHTGYTSDVMVENTEIFYANKVAEACAAKSPCADLADEIKDIETLEFYMRCVYTNEAKQNYTAAEKNIEILKDIRNGKVGSCI
ncbi:MAG: hypothetical protein ACXADH_17160 [Candidatus Kariarchaeaceae archaeon]|jgi:hypothetical protein